MEADRLSAVMSAGQTGTSLPAAGRVTVAIDVGGTHTRLAVVRDGVITARVTHLTSDLAKRTGSIVPELTLAVDRLTARECAGQSRAIGVGLAAAVDDDGGVIQPREFGIPAGTAVRDSLREALALPVVVENDANLAAWAEWSIGAARGARSVAVVTLGTNIGLGLVINGRIHRGAHGASGEVGLMLVAATHLGDHSAARPVVDAGPLGIAPSEAPAGYGRLEDLVGGRALAAAANGYLPPTPPRRVLTSEAVVNPLLRHLADRAVEGWALLIANMNLFLDVDVVVLTGSVAQDAVHLLPRLRERVADLIPFVPRIILGSLGPDAELLGADLLARAALDERVPQDARAGLSAHSSGGPT